MLFRSLVVESEAVKLNKQRSAWGRRRARGSAHDVDVGEAATDALHRDESRDDPGRARLAEGRREKVRVRFEGREHEKADLNDRRERDERAREGRQAEDRQR